MGKVGFGTYRVSIKSKEHYESLLHALKSGLSLIDTSANYTNGESEELIGKVLSEHPEFNPIIVTKAGYIQGKNLENIATTEDLVVISDNLKHSIHPIFLKDQISKSLARLKKESIDVFLLHNPEYYFKIDDANDAEFYQRIKKAFAYLEEEVKLGRIKSFGISSNHFVLPHSDPEWVSLEKIIYIAREVSLFHHFTHIQFPMNLVEVGALEKLGDYGEMSLVELAQSNNLITMSNRPLNAFSHNQLIRLATYENIVSKIDVKQSEAKFEECIDIINKRWVEEHLKDNDSEIDNILEVNLIKQFAEIWNKLPTPDAVDQVYHSNFFPFIANLWGGSLTKEESKPFYELYDLSLLYSRKTMDQKARAFRSQALSVGLIAEIDQENFAKEVIETYLNYGIDYVLVGMRKVEYIDQLNSLL